MWNLNSKFQIPNSKFQIPNSYFPIPVSAALGGSTAAGRDRRSQSRGPARQARRHRPEPRRHQAARRSCPACARSDRRSDDRTERAWRWIRREEGGGGRAAAPRVCGQSRGCDGQHHDARRARVFVTRECAAIGGSGHRGREEHPHGDGYRRSRRLRLRSGRLDDADQR